CATARASKPRRRRGGCRAMTNTLAELRDLLAALVAANAAKVVDARFLDVESAAAFTSLSADSIRRLLSAGKLTALRPVKGRVVIDREQLVSLVLNSTTSLRRGRGRRK